MSGFEGTQLARVVVGLPATNKGAWKAWRLITFCLHRNTCSSVFLTVPLFLPLSLSRADKAVTSSANRYVSDAAYTYTFVSVADVMVLYVCASLVKSVLVCEWVKPLVGLESQTFVFTRTSTHKWKGKSRLVLAGRVLTSTFTVAHCVCTVPRDLTFLKQN